MDHMSPSRIQEVLQGADKLVKELEIELGKLEEDFGKKFEKILRKIRMINRECQFGNI